MDSPADSELLRRAMDARLQAVSTAMPGIVVSYNAAKQTADVRPAVKRLVPSLEEGQFVAETIPVIPAVPVLWPRAGGSWFAPALEAGEGVLLIVCEVDPSTYLRTGEVSEPGDVRRHSLAHAVAIPGLYPRADALPAPALGGEAAALASKLDFLVSAILALVPAPAAGPDAGEPAIVALQAALTTAGWNAPGFTTGSKVLKLGE